MEGRRRLWANGAPQTNLGKLMEAVCRESSDAALQILRDSGTLGLTSKAHSPLLSAIPV